MTGVTVRRQNRPDAHLEQISRCLRGGSSLQQRHREIDDQELQHNSESQGGSKCYPGQRGNKLLAGLDFLDLEE